MDLWDRSEVGHRGRYSVERLLALGDYCERTSPARVLAVCLLGPLPALLVMLGIECIPLRDPADGWRANSAFWLRLGLSNFVISLGGVLQMKPVLVPGVITIKGALAIAAASSCCFVLSCLAVAILWVFPTPFGAVFNVGPYVLQFLFFVYLAIGPRVWATTPMLRQQMRKHLPLVAAEGAMVLIYPAYSAIFKQLPSNHQALFIFLLPVIKLTMKQTIAYVSADLDECVAMVVVFSADVFNMLYVSICIQTSTSPLMVPIIFAGDAIPIAVAIRTIYLQTKFSPHRRSGDPITKPKPERCPNYLHVLPARVLEAFQAHKGTQTLAIRVQAPISLPVSDKSRKLLDELISLQREGERGAVVTASTLAPLSLATIIPHSRMNSIAETPQAEDNQPDVRQRHVTLSATTRSLLLLNRPSRALVHPTKGQRKERPLAFPAPRRTSVDQGAPFRLGSFDGLTFRRVDSQTNNLEHAVQEALQALFHSEYIVLIEYIECTLPLLYAIYLGVLVHLPNVIFYPHAHALTPSKLSATLLTLTLYASFELVSLASVHVLLKRRFGFSPLYQVAFVLENHAATVQGHLLVWIVYILPFTLLHFGTWFSCEEEQSSVVSLGSHPTLAFAS
ncbi:hypothetical protein BBJ28_00024995 [Nothophytophthora sp. Chile5]|nr:hypothetical protein BBJ28_00024995 [Nothophytophthora sp. Chile5]